MKRFSSLVAILVSALSSAAASAQTVQSMQVYYEQNRPYLKLEGVSPVYWAPNVSDAVVTLQARSISIALCVDGGFSVMTPWTLSVPLSVSETHIYSIGVFMCAGNDSEQVGFLSAWVAGSNDLDGIFVSTFE